jgi:hypothetical protein
LLRLRWTLPSAKLLNAIRAPAYDLRKLIKGPIFPLAACFKESRYNARVINLACRPFPLGNG